MRPELHWEFLGRVPYGEAQALQEEAREAVKRGKGPERLLLLEHPHVYTLGRNASESDLLLDRAALDACGIEVAECDRGGQVTYHGPGQLVGYPVVNLSPDRRDIRRYVRDLQAALIETLASYGVEAAVLEEQEMVGVWVGRAKIASIGVHLSRWVTTHGFALNVATDLSFFQGIVACGLPGVEMTSLGRLLGLSPALPEVAERFALALAARIERVPVRVEGAAPQASGSTKTLRASAEPSVSLR